VSNAEAECRGGDGRGERGVIARIHGDASTLSVFVRTARPFVRTREGLARLFGLFDGVGRMVGRLLSPWEPCSQWCRGPKRPASRLVAEAVLRPVARQPPLILKALIPAKYFSRSSDLLWAMARRSRCPHMVVLHDAEPVESALVVRPQ